MTTQKTGREIALERRKALSSTGKGAMQAGLSDASEASVGLAEHQHSETAESAPMSARERRQHMSQRGQAGLPQKERTRAMVMHDRPTPETPAPVVASAAARSSLDTRPPQSEAQKRRAQLSKYGKAALSGATSPATASRTRAQSLRAMQSQFGKGVAESASNQGALEPSAAVTPVTADEITGTPIAQHPDTTGADRGLCREVTGTEYFSGEVFQSLCPRPKSPETPESEGVQVTGRVATSQLLRPKSQYADDVTADGLTVTGGEAVRSRVTGTDADKSPRMTGNQYRNTQMGAAPQARNTDRLMSSGRLTGHFLDAKGSITGDTEDRGSDVTGDNYAGNRRTVRSERPSAGRPHSGRRALANARVSGLDLESGHTTGTPEAVTEPMSGTPYTGSTARPQGRQAHSVTGTQPGIAAGITGDARGADGPISGTPYVGEDHLADAFGYDISERPERQFSVMSKVHAALPYTQTTGGITGSFGRGQGKVTGTDEGPLTVPTEPVTPAAPEERITGEGATGGHRITGDDWDRNPSVTGTEGRSAARRNSTRRGDQAPHRVAVSQPDRPANTPVSKVTGSSGNTSDGALITYSGGARG